jgi:pyrimidine deaminase RibD-like protein
MNTLIIIIILLIIIIIFFYINTYIHKNVILNIEKYAMKYAIYLVYKKKLSINKLESEKTLSYRNSVIQNSTSNIPIVACVIINNNKLISYGVSPINLNRKSIFHAEYIALKKAGQLAKNSTVIITLEPCWKRSNTLYGKSCTDLLIDAKVSKVIFGFPDKSIHANEKGLNKLRESGIIVISEFMKDELQKLYSKYKPKLKF